MLLGLHTAPPGQTHKLLAPQAKYLRWCCETFNRGQATLYPPGAWCLILQLPCHEPQPASQTQVPSMLAIVEHAGTTWFGTDMMHGQAQRGTRGHACARE